MSTADRIAFERENEWDFYHRYHYPETCFYVTQRAEHVVGTPVKCGCPVMSPELTVEHLTWYYGKPPTAEMVKSYNQTIFGDRVGDDA
jgi:hypothetical protein